MEQQQRWNGNTHIGLKNIMDVVWLELSDSVLLLPNNPSDHLTHTVFS